MQLPSDWLEVVRIYNMVSPSQRLLYVIMSVISGSVYDCTPAVFQPLAADVPEEGDGRQIQGVQRVSAGQVQHPQTPLQTQVKEMQEKGTEDFT